MSAAEPLNSPSRRLRARRRVDYLLAGACWLSFAVFLLLSESLPRFLRELLRLVAKL